MYKTELTDLNEEEIALFNINSLAIAQDQG